MPEISRFLGIIISMYFDEHNPPHFHAQYGESKAQILIKDLIVKQGELPSRVLGLVVEWAVLHRKELLSNWENARKSLKLKKIPPLA